jgi:2,3-bisphosphoglycerate-independent phosphoglycerate mutase
MRSLPKVEPTLKNNENAIFTANLIQILSEEIRLKLKNHHLNIERKNKGLTYTNFLTLRGCGQRL